MTRFCELVTTAGSRRFLFFGLLMVSVMSSIGLPPSAVAQETSADSGLSAAHHYFTDVPLVSHDGTQMRFYSDLLEGKTVVINAFFASCDGVCPVMAKSLAQIQERFGDRLEDDLRILSITVDPENDTPEALRRYALRWGAKPGWYFLSGDPENVRKALHKVGQLVEDKESHSSIMMIGNVETGLWKKANGMASAVELASLVDGVLKDEG